MGFYDVSVIYATMHVLSYARNKSSFGRLIQCLSTRINFEELFCRIDIE
ncbi:hypothetical protein C8N42_13013 [Celeribacter persicus]|uniref:Uncharacterized protein n=1 Tax=Celeribacter persicus TaxID=1651082 RepID=A0A2T5H433_9RHOB|nr:hypothetical protein C8N42_13013 [Celeribacter persicus]